MGYMNRESDVAWVSRPRRLFAGRHHLFPIFPATIAPAGNAIGREPMSPVLRHSGNVVLDARTTAGEQGTVCRRNSGHDGALETSALRVARFLTLAVGVMSTGEGVGAR